MATFVKAQAASLAATIIDFSITVILVEWFNCWYLMASITGTISGGIANFMLGRRWVFDATTKAIPLQAVKYLIVWGGNLMLVSSGVFLLTHYGGISYVASKVVASLIVGTSYNYLLQKKFVFRQ